MDSGSNATGTLATSLTSPGDAGTYTNPNNPADHELDLDDWVWGDPGISNANSVRDALDALIASGTTLTIRLPLERVRRGRILEWPRPGHLLARPILGRLDKCARDEA